MSHYDDWWQLDHMELWKQKQKLWRGSNIMGMATSFTPKDEETYAKYSGGTKKTFRKILISNNNVFLEFTPFMWGVGIEFGYTHLWSFDVQVGPFYLGVHQKY